MVLPICQCCAEYKIFLYFWNSQPQGRMPGFTFPLGCTANCTEYLPALVTHSGQWRHPERHQATGLKPKPRWLPLPGRLSAQVGKSSRRRRLVGRQHRVIVGAAQTVESILAKRGGQINTRLVERLPLDFRQPVAAIGRRGKTLCTYEAGLRQQWEEPGVPQLRVAPHELALAPACARYDP
jgi:hypothetical protein